MEGQKKPGEEEEVGTKVRDRRCTRQRKATAQPRREI